MFKRENLQNNSYLIYRMSNNLETPIEVIINENKIKSLCQDPTVILSVLITISHCSIAEPFAGPAQNAQPAARRGEEARHADHPDYEEQDNHQQRRERRTGRAEGLSADRHRGQSTALEPNSLNRLSLGVRVLLRPEELLQGRLQGRDQNPDLLQLGHVPEIQGFSHFF